MADNHEVLSLEAEGPLPVNRNWKSLKEQRQITSTTGFAYIAITRDRSGARCSFKFDNPRRLNSKRS